MIINAYNNVNFGNHINNLFNEIHMNLDKDKCAVYGTICSC